MTPNNPEFAKVRWFSDGDDIRIGMDISKVDKKKRMVYGWATLDNVDTEGDLLTKEASLDAFTRSRRNLREMHKKDSAVGRIVSFKEDSFRAPDGEIYNGIFVKVRVSEGAEDTWKKILDGTLNGFSIGGRVVEDEEIFTKSGAAIRKVLKYDLNELSLVDNPGNQYSDFTNIFKIRKSPDGSVTSVTGMLEDHKVLNVYYCDADQIVKESPDEQLQCPVCDEVMLNIGLVEDIGDREGKVKSLLTKAIGGGGENYMTKDKKQEESLETVETGHEAGDVSEIPTSGEFADGAGEATAHEPEVNEVEDGDDELEKKFNDFHNDIRKIIEKSSEDAEARMVELTKTIDKANALVIEKTSELEKRYSELDEKLTRTENKIAAVERTVEKINSGGALQKSVDSTNDEQTEEKQEDLWEGSAFSVGQVVRQLS